MASYKFEGKEQANELLSRILFIIDIFLNENGLGEYKTYLELHSRGLKIGGKTHLHAQDISTLVEMCNRLTK